MYKNKQIYVSVWQKVIQLILGIFLSIVIPQVGICAGGAPTAEVAAFKFSEKIVGGGVVYFDTSINNNVFDFGDMIDVKVEIAVDSKTVKTVIEQVDGLYLLVRAERIFDKSGRYHQFNNNYTSTILTPSGLPIENFDAPCPGMITQTAEFIDDLSAANKITGKLSKTPFYKICFLKKEQISFTQNGLEARFNIKDTIKRDILEGYYRFHVEVLFKKGRFFHRINFAPFFANEDIKYSDWDTSIIARSVSCLPVVMIGHPKAPQMVWTLFTQYYSNGAQGIIAIEDSPYFQFNSRHILSSKFIIPPGAQEYNLEPDFSTMFVSRALNFELAMFWSAENPIPLNYKSGQLTVSVKNPDGFNIELGTEPFRSASNLGATTDSEKFRYRFTQYGKYIITMRGWIADIWGHKYNGGGTYEVWVANRLSFATSVKPGTPFEVGNQYPPSVIINPPCPADIDIEVKLYRNSSKKNVKRYAIHGRANRFGYFYPRFKFKKMVLDSLGEYLSEIIAKYTDNKGALWMGTQRSGSVVAPENSKLIVHGSKIPAHFINANSPRGNLNYEGRFNDVNGPIKNAYTCCVVIPFPYYAGDILYVANSFRGDNGIVPVITLGITEESFSVENRKLLPKTATTNQYHPQGYPEFLQTQAYGYISAIRPGLSARFMILENNEMLSDAYWQSGGNFSGEQINNSMNGDLPGDIYEFFGGSVFRNFETGENLYGIYASMAVVIPNGSHATRVSQPFSEPLITVNGKEYYLFDSGAPLPGMVFELGDILRVGAMVSPPVKGVNCVKTITAPFGKKYTFKGTTNKIGLAKMTSPEGEEIIIKEPGVYEVSVLCESKGRQGDLLGSRNGKYFVYALGRNKNNELFDLGLPSQFSLDYKDVLAIKGKVTENIRNAKIYYTLVMPGAIIDEGTLPVENSSFFYRFLPRDTAVHFPNYDIVDYNDPTRQVMADTIIFTFFLIGIDNTGNPVNSVKRFILRGNQGMLLD